jgi:hypothetical protein
LPPRLLARKSPWTGTSSTATTESWERSSMTGRTWIWRWSARGLAWWYRHYAHEQSPADRLLYEDAENKAKAEGQGLWQDPDPMPPWQWRHRR